MIWFYQLFFPVVWVAYLLYWRIAALSVKTTQRLESLPSRALRTAAFLIAIVLLLLPNIPIPWLYEQVLYAPLACFWIGAAITVAGLLFSVWARVHIGRNWSSAVTIKQDHELITDGPYALVRHPIYTGLLTAFLGTAVALSQYRGLVAFALVFFSLWFKLRLEEKWMRAQFGETYVAYSQRVAGLIPWLL